MEPIYKPIPVRGLFAVDTPNNQPTDPYVFTFFRYPSPAFALCIFPLGYQVTSNSW
jgi:hypothetical protein